MIDVTLPSLAQENWVLLVVLGLGALGHTAALVAHRWRWSLAKVGLAAAAQGTLLVALVGISRRVLPLNDPASWWPNSAADVVETAAWLAMLVLLIGGFWWRSPGLGVTTPLLAMGLLTVVEQMAGTATVTRGLALDLAWRPVFRLAMAGALTLAGLAVAGLLARWLEGRLLGQPSLSDTMVIGMVAGAATCLSLPLGLAGYAWFTRGREVPLWTLQQTWLVAVWVAMVLAAAAGWQRRQTLPTLAVLASGLLATSIAVVSAVIPRP